MKYKLALTLTAALLTGPVAAQTCGQDFDFVSPTGHLKGASSIATLKKGFGAAAKGDFDRFMSVAASPYIQHSPDLPDGWKPVWDLITNRSDGFSSKQVTWLGADGFFDNGNYLVMFREVSHNDVTTKKFDLMYFDDNGLYSEHWDIAQPLANRLADRLTNTRASDGIETSTAAKFKDNPVQYDQPTEQANRRIVTTFLNLGFNGEHLDTALNLYADQDYIQHSPMIPDRTEPLVDLQKPETTPLRCYDIRFILTQNDMVWVYSKVTASDAITAVVDMFRVRDGKIVEHWDVVQPVPDDMPHDNGMF